MKFFTTLKVALLLLVVLPAQSLWSQTTLIDPAGDGGFETGTTFTANGWSVVNGTPVNRWVCNTGATAGFSGTSCAYITNNDAGTPPPYAYTNTAASTVHMYRDVTFPAGETKVTLSFSMIMTGESGWDRLLVYVSNGAPSGTPTAGTPSSNTTTLTGYTLLSTQATSATWVTRTINLTPAQAGNASAAAPRRILFVWQNDGGGGSNPPIAIDNISLTSQSVANNDCAGATSFSISSNGACSYTTVSTHGATQSSPAPACTSTGGDDDIWYTITPTITGVHTIRYNTLAAAYGTASTVGYDLYTGTCGSLTAVSGACNTGFGSSGSGTVSTPSLTASTTYYLRLWVGSASNSGSWNMCFEAPTAPCSGSPTGGTVAPASQTICTGSAVAALTVSGYSTGTGITLQWQESATSGGPWSNATGGSGATTATYTPPSFAGTTIYYRCLVTCTASSMSTGSTESVVTANTSSGITYTGSYPYSQSFESWSSACSTTDVPTTNFKNTPATGNNSWRRNDQGTSASWSSTSGAYSPTSTQGTYSARFHSFNASSGSQGSLDFYFDASAFATMNLNFDYINTSGTDVLAVLISTDGGGSFTQSGSNLGTQAAWGNKAFTLNTANSATCVVRLRATSDFGATDIGVDNFVLDSPNCSGTPTGGTVTPTSQTLCSGASSANLVLAGMSTSLGITYQWQESDDNGVNDPWANVSGGSGATTTTYTPPAFAGTTIYYRCLVTCTNSSQSTPSSVSVINPPAAPTTQASAIVITRAGNPSSMTITWTNGNGNGRYAVVNTTNSFTNPVNGTTGPATPNTVYGGSGEQVVYDGTSTTVTVTGLACDQTYWVRVYEYNKCTTPSNSWVYNVSTATNNPNSAAALSTSASPYTENFGTSSTLPTGWVNVSSTWLVGSTHGQSGSGAYRNIYSTVTLGEVRTMPIGPLASGDQLKFDTRVLNFTSYPSGGAPTGSWGSVQVAVSTNCGASYTTLATYTDIAGTSWITKTVDLSAYSGQTVLVKFVGSWTSGDWYVDIDNINIAPPPACSAPSAPVVSNVTGTTANLSWTAAIPAPANGYEWAVTTSATPPASGTNTTSTTASASSLTPSTTYYLHVRSDCSGSGYSTWVTSSSFTTTIVNNEPSGAIALSVGVPANIVTTGATQTLAACVGTADDDVWYSFTPPADGTYKVVFTGLTGNSDIGYEIFSSTSPSSANSISCHDGPDAGTHWDGLLSSVTYMIRVYTYSSTSTVRITGGTITMDNPTNTPPANDACSGAIAVTPSSNGSCSYTSLNSTGGSYSMGRLSCVTSYNPPANDDDIWVSFTPTISGTHTFRSTSSSTFGLQVYTGSCGSLTAFGSCVSSFTGTTGTAVASLVSGTTYYARLWNTGTSSGSAFDICIEQPATCGTATTLTSASITASSAVLNWTETGLSTNWEIEYVTSPFTFTGTANVTNITAKPYTLNGLTQQTDYQFKVRGTGCTTWSAASSTFTTTPPNDNVANATPITIGATCSGNAFSNRGATTETGEPAPTCQSSYSRTVWYSFTPTTAAIYATTDLGTPTGMTDGVMSLFTGNPASFATLVPVACDDDGGITNSTMPVLSAAVSPGQTYYLRVAQYGTGAGGDYCLEVKEGEIKVPSTSACATTYTNSITTALGNTNQWVSVNGTSGDIVAAVNANGQNLGTVTVNVYTTTTIRTDALGQPYLNRNYRVTSSTLPASPVGVRLYFTDTEIADLIAHPSGGGTLADYNVTHVAGAACATAFAGTGSLITQSNSADLAGNTSYLEFTTPGFSAFYVNKGPLALPLQLISFTGKALENSNLIEWETANEKNVANHIVERSADGIQWTEIGRKTGHADSDQRLKYQLEDLTPMVKSYYRLRSVDYDGQESVSKTILLTRRNDQFGITNLLPNPAFERVMVQFAVKEEGNVIVRITDINGRIVAEQSYEAIEGLNEAPVYLSQLQAGVYNVSITSGSEVSAPVRLIKQ